MSKLIEMNELFEQLAVVTFSNGISLIKGTDCWIGSDSCEYDDPLDYLTNGSPVEEVFIETERAAA